MKTTTSVKIMISQPHDDDDNTFGMGYSTIAHISEHSSDEELETKEQDDEFNMFNSGFSNIANISEEEDDNRRCFCDQKVLYC